jgi:hypothetical protein
MIKFIKKYLNKNIFFNIIIFNNYQNINIKKIFKFKFFILIITYIIIDLLNLIFNNK